MTAQQDELTEDEEHITQTHGLFDSIFAVFMMSIFQGVHININYYSNISIFAVILIFIGHWKSILW